MPHTHQSTKKATLETFLGGMETIRLCGREYRALDLETFLGGMETQPVRMLVNRCTALKPSLVEWKLRELLDDDDFLRPLKPSLVEWKPETGEAEKEE